MLVTLLFLQCTFVKDVPFICIHGHAHRLCLGSCMVDSSCGKSKFYVLHVGGGGGGGGG